ncbi:ubiquitin-conjugating enzyme E2 J1, putative [Perkinsus marinus ATCC 50983]|uniref:Ubiquitin-conjugating enzyme E2 J1, putative n=1 Tax=Perkinsus marinus (strain ATCC 50983 / TXsc) TaxID=423536 RepID=C5L7P8_PERM5|nr:ubiquitin-conjugating enzyme E2 J1, putative [Perkinsus marinus ATCC 50983]EER07510.1 ubiquitin-conjugating enzyme E2 J1, putative [Perkinsus marinus ATCC 50983]|eukprot:XP_002775694.1 ubiquitin-conjugating enzyme E2 J1, putative [Perkinsus marinus ATCC 50983]
MATTNSSSSGSHVNASSQTIRRIQREILEIQRNPSSNWTASPTADSIFEWHYTFKGPPGTEFEGGRYHGRIVLPSNYPFGPPVIMLLTPNGRFEVNKKICLSISSYHPELWQPAWGIRTIMEALRSFMPTPGEGAIGALDWPAETRRQLAEESRAWTCKMCEASNEDLLPGGDDDKEDLPQQDSDDTEDVPKPMAFVALNNEEELPSSPKKAIDDTPETPTPTGKQTDSPGGNADEQSSAAALARRPPRKMSMLMQILAVIGFAIALIVDCFRHPPEAFIGPSGQ